MKAKEIQSWLIAQIAELLGVPSTSLDIREPLANYGLSSRDAVSLSGDLEELLNRKLPVTLLYEYPTIDLLARHLEHPNEVKSSELNSKQSKVISSEPIAIVGIACRFPGGNNPEAFWHLLSHGVDAISEVPSDRWNGKDTYHPDPSSPGKSISYWGGFLERIDQFDPFFFGITPMEAKQMDPQQRLLLELSHEALEDAGQVREDIQGTKTGVFIGISVNEYSLLQLADPLSITSHSGTGSALSIAANRISYFYDFHGPSVAIDTACSSSLASVHLACQSLHRGECKMALAGGVNLILSPAHSIAFTKAGLLAPDGRCKTFDSRANGYVRGEGGGLVVLKPLSSALADHDHIYAVIKGSALNQDGRSNGLMAPSPEAQEALLRDTYLRAGIDPGTVQYVEAHGTGTLLGDEIEARTLGSVVGGKRTNGACKIGSVKTNIGHLEAAAGIAGLIKVILSIKHRMIPPSIHYETPNPHISFDELNLQVARQLTPWQTITDNLIAGVSSFGFGGTNVHVVVCSADSNDEKNDKTGHGSGHNLLALSAGSAEALQALANRYAEFLSSNSEVSIGNICYTASVRRSHLGHRLAVIGSSMNELKRELQFFNDGVASPGVLVGSGHRSSQPKLVFVFPGQGGQWIGMGRELIKHEPVFREVLEQCDRVIQSHFKWSLIDLLVSNDLSSHLDDIGFIQPALFSIEVALAKLWQSWNVIPDLVVGHSMGEVAAAHIAGVLNLEDSIKVICLRSQLLRKSLGQGSMIATALTSDRAEELVKAYGHKISIAALNSPESTVLSGDPDSIRSLMEALQQQNLFCQLINVDIASHSPQMEQYRDELIASLESINPKSAKIPIYSTVTGTADNLVFNADYWVDNLRKPVRFFQVIQEILNSGPSTFIEIGPHPVLLSSIQQTLVSRQQIAQLLPSLHRTGSEQLSLFRSLGLLYAEGFNVDWKTFYSVRYKLTPLPSYPWQRQRFWVDANLSHSPLWHLKKESSSAYLLGSRINLADSEDKFVWQTEFDVRILPFLNDHKVEHEIVVPAAVFIEIGFKAATEIGITTSHEMSQWVFHKKMNLRHGEQLMVQTVVSKEGGDGFSLGIYSYSSADKVWFLHAATKFVTMSPAKSREVQAIDELKGSSLSYSGEGLYQKLSAHGIDYGPGFRGVEMIWVKGDHALGKVRLPEGLRYGLEKFVFHPALLDACLHVIAAIVYDAGNSDIYVPAACSKICIYGDTKEVTYSYVVRRIEISGDDVQRFDIELLNEKGQKVGELVDFALQRIRRRALSPSTISDIKLYHTRWKKIAAAKTHNTSHKEKRTWLILSDADGHGEKLAERIERSGDTCRLVHYSKFVLGPDREAGDELIEKIIDESSSPVYGIIHLASLSVPDLTSFQREETDLIYSLGANSILMLVKAFFKRGEGFPRLWIVTRGSQPVSKTEEIAFGQSPVWGLGKVISFELPELKCVRIDLDPDQDSDSAVKLLYDQLLTTDNEDQIAFRKNSRFALRILPYQLTQTPASHPKKLNLEGTYLITGGLGGLGLALASRLVQMGVQHLVLLGRSEPSDAHLITVESLRKTGAQVVVFKADVSDRLQVGIVFEEIKKNLPPLTGIFHAAGILDDGALTNLNSERMKRVMAPKIEGTLNLHNASARLPLDFFVLFSSAVSVLGSPGQGNYAAASSFLDSFAHYRASIGLPAQSINWGPWAEAGLAAQRLQTSDHSNQQLVKLIQLNQGMEILEALLNEPVTQVSVLPFDLANLLELYPPASQMPFFEDTLNNATYFPRSYARPTLRQAYVAPRNGIEHRLVEIWQLTLHVDRVGVLDSFFELGGDSVLAAQILTSVQKSFSVRIDLKEAFKVFTVERLAIMIEGALMSKIEAMTEREAEEELMKQKLS